MEMVFVPGGEFQMGSNDGDGDQQPVHTVLDFVAPGIPNMLTVHCYLSSQGAVNGLLERIGTDSKTAVFGLSWGICSNSILKSAGCMPSIEVAWV